MSSLTKEHKATNYDTFRHIERVRNLINEVVRELLVRSEKHDQSKMTSPEVELFTEYTDKLAGTTFGSEQYNQFKKEMKPALDHHYANNRHHPEFVEYNEVWKDVVGYEGYYEVSNLGKVRSCDKIVQREKQGNFSKKGKIRKAHVTPKGYARLMLQVDGKKENKFVHTLVAEAFLVKEENKNQINHKNGNKLDNTITNLEWVTANENIQHAYDTGLMEGNIKYVVYCNELDILTFGCEKMQNELRIRGYNALSSGIWSCVAENGKHNTHAGLTFSSWNIDEYRELNSPINDMTLIDLIEMLVDWKAASERHNDGNILKSIEHNGSRFEMSPQLIRIFENTAKEMF